MLLQYIFVCRIYFSITKPAVKPVVFCNWAMTYFFITAMGIQTEIEGAGMRHLKGTRNPLRISPYESMSMKS